MFKKALEKIFEEDNTEDINEMFSYELLANGELTLLLNRADYLEWIEKREQLNQGLQKLAYMLEHQPELKEVQKISGLSWISTVHPKLLENLGFTLSSDPSEYSELREKYDTIKLEIPPEYKDTEPTYAYISREDFLKKYGLKSEDTDTEIQENVESGDDKLIAA